MNLTMNLYEHLLNDNPPPADSDLWIIKGKYQSFFQRMGRYGSALRKYDFPTFEKQYDEFVKSYINIDNN